MKNILVILFIAFIVGFMYRQHSSPPVVTETPSDSDTMISPVEGVVASAWRHTLVLASNGKIYGWGVNKANSSNELHLELGLADIATTQVPQMLSNPARWTAIHSGTRASYAIDEEGKLWRRPFQTRFSSERTLQDGDAALAERYHPIFPMQYWTKVHEDWGMAGGLTQTGQLFLWDDKKIADAANPIAPLVKPRPEQTVTGWSDFCLGGGVVYAVADDGSLWRSDTPTDIFKNIMANIGTSLPMHAVIAQQKFQKVFCRENTARVFLIDQDNHLWVFGNDRSGSLGLAKDANDVYEQTNDVDIEHMRQVGTDRWVTVTLAQSTTYAIRADGSLWGWGRNMDGELGVSSKQSRAGAPLLIDDKHTWRAISAGSSYGVGVTNDGEIYTWGARSHVTGDIGSTMPTKLESDLKVKMDN